MIKHGAKRPVWPLLHLVHNSAQSRSLNLRVQSLQRQASARWHDDDLDRLGTCARLLVISADETLQGVGESRLAWQPAALVTAAVITRATLRCVFSSIGAAIPTEKAACVAG
jgi:hypothetical protein